ncbi:carbamoyltransferase [Isosphaeraceae bacterium EP7]
MTTAILGLSAFYHDSAAALVVDGKIVAAAQEERFSRVKHDPAFPRQAVEFCLGEAGLTPADLSYVAYYEKPLAKLDRLIETYTAYAPQGLGSFSMAMTVWLREKLLLRRAIRAGLGGETRARLLFNDHHESHAASAFFASPFDRAAILTLDGVGEWATTTMGIGSGNRITLSDQIRFPHSLGLLYSAFTTYCGFKVNSGEYKLMGLAPYGRPVYRDLILRELIDLKPDGSFRLNMAYFRYPHGLTMTGRRFHTLFGGPPRTPESDLDQRHMNLAASIQAVLEEVVLRIAAHLRRKTGERSLVLAGGVALNCVANGRILRESGFDDLWIQPAAGDAGGALGAALFAWHQLLDRPRVPNGRDAMRGSLLGPSYTTADCLARVELLGGVAQTFEDEAVLIAFVAGRLAEGKVVGWFQGRMEFGPRSLGARSILGDPRSPAMQSTMNLKIKFRESFRPFAPAVLAESAHDWFELEPGQDSPYMLLVANVRESRRVPISAGDEELMRDDPDLRRRVQVARSTIPAVTHVDQSARVQTVDAERNPRFHRLLAEFGRLTGCPVLVNTSFNVRGEPIVNTPEDAYLCFQTTGMDLLVLENLVVEKGESVASMTEVERERHLSRFAPD